MLSAHAQEQQDCSEHAEFTKQDRPDAPELPEKDTISQAQHGDASAFGRLYKLHSARVYALCLRMTGNTAEAEDLMQDVFLMVFRKIRTFRGDSAFSTWLHRVAVNLVLMRMRGKTALETPLEENTEVSNDRSGTIEKLVATDLFMVGSLDRLTLERALEKLQPFQKLVVVLHDIQGYKHSEIAEMMDWTIGNSKSRLHRARARLRKLLRKSLSFRCMASSQTAQAAFSA
jgi:RNA polymerase sigma-70 factor (ECF subfamily)